MQDIMYGRLESVMPIDDTLVRSALKLCHDPYRLGLHPLGQLYLVVERHAYDHANSQLEVGQLLKQLLLDAVETLRPDEKLGTLDKHQHRRYQILIDHFVNHKLRAVVAYQLGLRLSAYHSEQKHAVLQVTSVLTQWEAEARNRAMTTPNGHTDNNIASGSLILEQIKSSHTNPITVQLMQWLVTDQPMVGMVGNDGAKCAQHIAELIRNPIVRARFPDGVVYARLTSEQDLSAILSSWLTDIQPHLSRSTNETVSQVAQQVRDYFADRSTLIVLDQVQSLAQVLALNLGGQRCACVFVTEALALAITLAGDRVVSLL